MLSKGVHMLIHQLCSKLFFLWKCLHIPPMDFHVAIQNYKTIVDVDSSSMTPFCYMMYSSKIFNLLVYLSLIDNVHLIMSNKRIHLISRLAVNSESKRANASHRLLYWAWIWDIISIPIIIFLRRKISVLHTIIGRGGITCYPIKITKSTLIIIQIN